MGSVGLTNALYDMSLELKDIRKPLFSEVILAAPDIDEKEFAKLFRVFQKITKRTTLNSLANSFSSISGCNPT